MKLHFINHFLPSFPSQLLLLKCTLHPQMLENVLHLSSSDFLKDLWESFIPNFDTNTCMSSMHGACKEEKKGKEETIRCKPVVDVIFPCVFFGKFEVQVLSNVIDTAVPSLRSSSCSP